MRKIREDLWISLYKKLSQIFEKRREICKISGSISPGGGRLDSPKNLVFSPILTQKRNESAFFVQTKNAPLSTQKNHSFNLQLFAEKDSTQKKKKYLPLIISIFIIIALAIASIPVISIVTKKDTKAFKYDDTTNYVEVGELWNGSFFNATNLNTLISYLSTGYTTDADVTATDIRGYTANGKTSSQAVVVTLGGLKWQVVYLTNNTSGERTATLWLTNFEQDAFMGRASDEGSYYGYKKSSVTGRTILASSWSAGWDGDRSGWSDMFPSGMYGTSYIRAVTLNNGGIYATSSTTSETATQNSNSAFAQFTMGTEGAYNDLTDFIVKPSAVKYQMETQFDHIGFKYIEMNDSLATDLTGYRTDSNGTEYNFQGNEYYRNWGSDNLWLPSIQETGYSGVNGIWQINVNERMISDNSATWFNFWLRSCIVMYSNYATFLKQSGADSSSERVDMTCAVRPALHLNLDSAVRYSAFQVTATAEHEEEGVITIEATYNELGAPYAVKDSEVTITATPNTGYAFDYWIVNGTKITTNPYTFTITEDTTAVAYFKLKNINITSPNTELTIKSSFSGSNAVCSVTPVTSEMYIYSIQVDSNTAQVLKSRSGILDNSGASDFIRYTVNEGNQRIVLEIFTVTGDINITISYTSTNPNLPNLSGGITGTVVTATEGGEARIVGNDIANGEDTDIVVFAAVPYTGYTFAGWVNGNDETEQLGTANQLSIRLTKTQINGKVVKAVFVKNTNSNINDQTNNTDDIL